MAKSMALLRRRRSSQRGCPRAAGASNLAHTVQGARVMVKPHVAAVVWFLGAAGAWAQSAPPSPPPYRCDSADHRAFDFWIGRWDVYVTGTHNLAGRSIIERADAGCVITEQWTGAAGAPFSGRSLNAYEATTGKWVQFWMDSGGEVTRYEGGPVGGAMVLTAPDETRPGRPGKAHLRMTFTANADGSVRQHGESSADGGGAWSTSYDFTYRRR
jgi:hypothetical protein